MASAGERSAMWYNFSFVVVVDCVGLIILRRYSCQYTYTTDLARPKVQTSGRTWRPFTDGISVGRVSWQLEMNFGGFTFRITGLFLLWPGPTQKELDGKSVRPGLFFSSCFFSCRCGLLQARPERLLIERERAVHRPPSRSVKKDMAAGPFYPRAHTHTHTRQKKNESQWRRLLFLKFFFGWGVCY
jgi:hypothetical protein